MTDTATQAIPNPTLPPPSLPAEAQETALTNAGMASTTGNGPVQAEHTGPVSGITTPISGQAQAPQQPTADQVVAAAAAAGAAVSSSQPNKAPVTMRTAQQISKAISLGLVAMPTTAGGWAKLVDQYNSPGAEAAAQAKGKTGTPTTGTPGAGGDSTLDRTPTSGTPIPATGLNKFLWAIRTHESGGDYTATSATGGASGAYQFIQSTWTSEANAAGYGQYANKPAGTAPASVQDAVAGHMAQGYWNQFHTWSDAAQSWYDPAMVGQNAVPAPTAGNTETETDYGAQIVKLMGGSPAVDATAPNSGTTGSIAKIAQSQLGVPYQWGGESEGQNFDCSGLVQWTYSQAGVTLPRVAQTQYNATAKLSATAPLQSGDLLFFGTGTTGIEHVGIYIGTGKMIDAPHTGADVRIDTVFGTMRPTGAPGQTLVGNYVGATRPNDPTGSTTAGVNGMAAIHQQAAGTRPVQNYNQAALLQYVAGKMEGYGL